LAQFGLLEEPVTGESYITLGHDAGVPAWSKLKGSVIRGASAGRRSGRIGVMHVPDRARQLEIIFGAKASASPRSQLPIPEKSPLKNRMLPLLQKFHTITIFGNPLTFSYPR
jgi:hypothetical protein